MIEVCQSDVIARLGTLLECNNFVQSFDRQRSRDQQWTFQWEMYITAQVGISDVNKTKFLRPRPK